MEARKEWSMENGEMVFALVVVGLAILGLLAIGALYIHCGGAAYVRCF